MTTNVQLFYRTFLALKIVLKRDAFRLVLWLLALTFLATFDAGKNDLSVQNVAQAASLYALLKNPAMIGLFGPPHVDLAQVNNGTAFAQSMTLFASLIFAVISISFVIDRSRKEEDTGLTELIRSFSIGKLSMSAVLILEMLALHLLLTFAIAESLQFMRIPTMLHFSDNLLFAASIAAQSLLWAMLALLFAQIFPDASRAKGASLGLLGILYAFRLVTDLHAPGLSWLDPLSWSYLTAAYAKNVIFPLFLTLLLTLAIIVCTLVLQAKRDLGSAYIRESKSKTRGRHFRHIESLLLHQRRGLMMTWTVGLFVFAYIFGATFDQMNSFLAANAIVRQLMTASDSASSPLSQFLAMLFSLFAILVACFALVSLNQLAQEEQQGRLEQLYALTLSRSRLYLSSVFLALFLGFGGQFISVLGLYAGQMNLKNAQTFASLFRSGMVWLPAITLTISLLALLIGFTPRAAAAIWGYIGFAAFIVYSGNFVHFPSFVRALNAFSAIPKLPVARMNWQPIWLLLILSLIFICLGLLAYRRRDLQ